MALLTASALGKTIRENDIDSLYYFYGHDTAALESFTKRLVNKLCPADAQVMNFHKLDGKNLDFPMLTDACEALPFMAERVVVTINDLNIDAVTKDDLDDLKKRFGDILVAYSYTGKPIYARDLHAEGAMTALMKDAIKPNLIQTLEGTPCLMHGGPFANIAHGCNSVQATKLALKLGDIAITEAGFGADLGAEKFMDIKCRKAGLAPDCIVLVATVRALKYNGGVAKADLNQPNMDALKHGICNLDAHLDNMKKFGVPVVVAVNAFPTDTDEEMDFIREHCAERGVRVALSEVFAKGGEGGQALADEVLAVLDESKADFHMLYEDSLPLEDKIRKIAKEIYGALGVTIAPAAKKELANITEMGYGNLPVCVAKTQYSLSDDASLLGRPTEFVVNVRTARLAAGAGFVVVETGSIMTMPGLPKVPAAEKIDVDSNGKITGLF